MTYTARSLVTMSLRQLADAGESLGLSFNKSHNKQTRREMILAEQARRAAASDLPAAAPSTTNSKPVAPSPEFESLLNADAEALPIEDHSSSPQLGSQWGGSRPGSGRPAGMTNDIAAMNRLSQQPHPFVKSSLQMLFRAWAARVGVAEVALTEDEAIQLALCWTQVGDYLGVTEKIPVWLQLAITTTWTTANIVAGKARVIKLARERDQATPKDSVTSEAA